MQAERDPESVSVSESRRVPWLLLLLLWEGSGTETGEWAWPSPASH